MACPTPKPHVHHSFMWWNEGEEGEETHIFSPIRV